MRYPDKKEFALYGLERPDFRRRCWRLWESKHPIGAGEWWADVSLRIKVKVIEARIVHHMISGSLKRMSAKCPLPVASGKTVRGEERTIRFVRLLPLEAQ